MEIAGCVQAELDEEMPERALFAVCVNFPCFEDAPEWEGSTHRIPAAWEGCDQEGDAEGDEFDDAAGEDAEAADQSRAGGDGDGGGGAGAGGASAGQEEEESEKGGEEGADEAAASATRAAGAHEEE